MAENLMSLKRRIRTAVNISQIAKAMEMISASKIRRAKEAVENNRPYAERITRTVEEILSGTATEGYESPYLSRPASSKRLLIALSPDKGLCGSLPDNLARTLLRCGGRDAALVTVGRRIEKTATRYACDLKAAFPMGTTLPKYHAVYPVIEVVNSLFFSGQVGEVSILYAEFKGMLRQEPVIRQLLPIQPAAAEKKEAGVFTFEPGIAAILAELLPYYVEARLYNAFINAYTSEQAARMISMQNAKNNAIDIRDNITLAYNKLRQSKITNEILDITNSSFA